MESAHEVVSPGVESSWLELSTCFSPTVNGLLAIMCKTKGPVLVPGSSSSCPCWLNLSIFSLGGDSGDGKVGTAFQSCLLFFPQRRRLQQRSERDGSSDATPHILCQGCS